MVRTSEKLSRRTSRLAYHNLVTSTRGPKSGKNFILCAKISCSCSLSAYSRVTEVQLRTSKARKEGSACVGVGWHSKFPFLGGLVGLLPPGKRGSRRARAASELRGRELPAGNEQVSCFRCHMCRPPLQKWLRIYFISVYKTYHFKHGHAAARPSRRCGARPF